MRNPDDPVFDTPVVDPDDDEAWLNQRADRRDMRNLLLEIEQIGHAEEIHARNAGLDQNDIDMRALLIEFVRDSDERQQLKMRVVHFLRRTV